MTDFAAAWAVEVRKAARSRVPAVTVAVFTLVPAVGALFMFILADPDRARRLGLLNQKAQLSGLSADWPGMLTFAAQAVAVGSLAGWSRPGDPTCPATPAENTDRISCPVPR